jgi:glycosyltransferase involved in cell wall biosynthesis
MTADRPYLLDVTRMVALGWSGKRPTGIDRVCDAYLQQYQTRSHAVIQHRGIFRIFNSRASDKLFELLQNRGAGFRSRFVAQTPSILKGTVRHLGDVGNHGNRIYLNVGHTDFDLSSHHQWVEHCGFKAVYLIHDLIPIDAQGFCSPHATKRHRGRVVNALKSAAGIIVNSEATAFELEQFAKNNGLPLPQVIAAHLGCSGLPGRGNPPRNASATPIEQSYFVCVGTIEPRKNHLFLLHLWQRLIARKCANRSPIPRLVLIGQWGANSDAVKQFLQDNPQLASHITMVNGCNDAAMARWVRGARAVLLPTLAEGFGLPLVEAMAMGSPVIASDLPVFREIGGGIPLLINPADGDAWEAAIAQFIRGCAELERQKEKLTRYQPPNWEAHFGVIDLWLQKLTIRNHTKSQRAVQRAKTANNTPQYSDFGRYAAGNKLLEPPAYSAEQPIHITARKASKR